jgi:endonuclease/exonuclease/phosphatase (EEP) superfamily protein YafD
MKLPHSTRGVFPYFVTEKVPITFDVIGKVTFSENMNQKISVILAAIALFVLAVLSLSCYIAWSWPLELLSHFRIQYLLLSLILSGVIVFLKRNRYLKNNLLVFVSLLVVGLNSIEVVPWYLPHPQQTSANADKQIRVLSFNLNIQNDNYKDVINLTQDNQPDIALFIEVSQATVQKLQVGLKDSLPYVFRSPGGGLAIFSRLPIKDAKGDNLNGQGGHNLIATIQVDKQPIQFIGTHPLVPIKPSTFHRRNRQLAALSNYISSLNQPLILIGDFNLTPWSPYYRRFINKTKLHNTRLGFGILPSWPRTATHVNLPSWIIPLVNIPIDHCFVSKQFKVVRTYTGGNANSDHASLITDLVLNELK